MGGDEHPRLRTGSFRLLDSGAEGGVSTLTVDACTESEEIGELKPGTVVQVVEVQKVLSPKDGEDRIRGRIEDEKGSKVGWVSMVDLTNDFSWVEPCDNPPQLGPGTYHIIHDNATVTEGQSTSTADLGKLKKGTVVEVLEVVAIADEHRIRGRIEKPLTGWFSMVKTTNDYRWAEKAPPANSTPSISAAASSLTTVGSAAFERASAAATTSASTVKATSTSAAASASETVKAGASKVATASESAATSASEAAKASASSVTIASTASAAEEAKIQSPASAYGLSVGDSVQARWDNTSNFYGARVAAFNADGTVAVDWDSGAWIKRTVRPEYVVKKGQASFGQWYVLHEGGVRVRKEMSKNSPILGQKSHGEKFSGRALPKEISEEPWLALEDEGFMLVHSEGIELLRKVSRAQPSKPALFAAVAGLVLVIAFLLKALGFFGLR